MKFTVPTPHILLLLLSALEAPTLASARALALAVPSESRPLTQNEYFIPQDEAQPDPLVSSRNFINNVKEDVRRASETTGGPDEPPVLEGPQGDDVGEGSQGEQDTPRTSRGPQQGGGPGQPIRGNPPRAFRRQVESNATSTTSAAPEATDDAARPALVIKPIEDEEPLAPEGGEVAV